MDLKPKSRIKSLLTIAILLCLSESALALRCGSRLVKEGMAETEVIELCGEPVEVTEYGYVLRPYIIKLPAGEFGMRSTRRVFGGHHEALLVRELLFNFGPHRLMRLIRFEGGRVTSIESAGYGYTDAGP